jgi:hypothetical protein
MPAPSPKWKRQTSTAPAEAACKPECTELQQHCNLARRQCTLQKQLRMPRCMLLTKHSCSSVATDTTKPQSPWILLLPEWLLQDSSEHIAPAYNRCHAER